MADEKDIRWVQRFEHFDKAFNFLSDAVRKPELNELEKSGMVQSFEFTFELAWKTLKDYLEFQGRTPKFPRDTIKQSFETALLEDGHLWIEMLDKRNELTHTYNQRTADRAVEIIRDSYFPAIEKVHQKLAALKDE